MTDLGELEPGAMTHLNLREADRRAKRDHQREETERHYAEQAARHRAEHIATVAAVFRENESLDAEGLAAIAVDALLADGVVFASMCPCEDPYP